MGRTELQASPRASARGPPPKRCAIVLRHRRPEGRSSAERDCTGGERQGLSQGSPLLGGHQPDKRGVLLARATPDRGTRRPDALPALKPRCRRVQIVKSLDDWARFLPDDPTDLVIASFACPLCLRRANLVVLEDDEGACSATCRCVRCEQTWTIAMRPDQYLRMTLLPGRELAVVDSSYGAGREYWPFPS